MFGCIHLFIKKCSNSHYTEIKNILHTSKSNTFTAIQLYNFHISCNFLFSENEARDNKGKIPDIFYSKLIFIIQIKCYLEIQKTRFVVVRCCDILRQAENWKTRLQSLVWAKTLTPCICPYVILSSR